jgi:hypothetical protein
MRDRAMLLAVICAAATIESKERGTAMNDTRGGVGGGRSGGRHISALAYAKYTPTAFTEKPSLPNNDTGTTATTDIAG